MTNNKFKTGLPILPSRLTVALLRASVLAVIGCCASAPAATSDWQTLFDGTTLAAWKTYAKPVDAPVGWAVEEGALAWRQGCGNLVTKETFRDFELELEWKISPGGNSGVMFGVDESGSKPW